MTFPGGLIDVIAHQVDKADERITSGGTVAEVTPASNRAQVQMDGSGLAVPVKVFGDVSCAPGDRVGLLKIGTDWTVIGTYTRRRNITMPDGAATGQQRMVFGADTPPELVAFGITVALLAYVTDDVTGLEVGYFFIGLSNVMDTGHIRALVFGNVTYPTPGNPNSATASNVKTNLQMQSFVQQARTVFKDHSVYIYQDLPLLIGNDLGVLARVGIQNEDAINKQAIADTTTSATAVPMSESAWNADKLFDLSFVTLEVDFSLFSTAANTEVEYGINYGGTDYVCGKQFITTGNEHQTMPPTIRYIGGSGGTVPAGNYTPYLWWRRSAGAGTLTRATTNWISARTREVLAP